jgi:hypothetical protein
MSFALLPQECKTHIFSFLQLEHVLEFSTTSQTSLNDVLPDLFRRRQCMRLCSAYSRDWKTDRQGEKMGLWNEMIRKYPNIHWVKIPSAQERIEELYKVIPTGHPLCPTVYKLKQELAVDLSLDDVATDCPGLAFKNVLSLYVRLVVPQRMHAEILTSVIHSNELQHADSTVSLDKYMGDVLCVAYLINQSSLRIVEGGPSNVTFFRHLKRQHKNHQCTSSSSYSYLSWIYLHSSILRVKSFTPTQRERLGIPEFFGLSEMMPNDCYINESFMSTTMTLVYNEFGPLGGPGAFRGRDVMLWRDVPACRLFALLITNDHDPSQQNGRRGVVNNRNPPRRNPVEMGQTARVALEWLFLVHDQSRKSRPMSVRPPHLRLCIPSPLPAAAAPIGPVQAAVAPMQA